MNTTIKGKIQLLLWAGLAGILILSIFIFIATSTQRSIGQRLTTINNNVIDAKDVSDTMRQARQYDKDFIRNPSDDTVTKVHADIKALNTLITRIDKNSDVNHQQINAIKNGITNYDNAFQTFTSVVKLIGYTQKEGLLGSVNKSEDALEKLVNTTGNPNLIIETQKLELMTSDFFLHPSGSTYSIFSTETNQLDDLAKSNLTDKNLATYNSIMLDYKSYMGTLQSNYSISDSLLDQFTSTANQVDVGTTSIINHLTKERQTIYNRQHTIQTTILILMILLSLLTIVTLFFFGRRLIRSISESINILKEGAQKMGDGKLHYRLPLIGNDELTELARTFNNMAVGMESTMQKVMVTTDTLSSSSQNLAAISQETTAQSIEVNEAIQQVAVGAQTQAEYLEDGMTMIGNVLTAINQTARLSDDIDQQSEDAKKASQKGMTVVDDLEHTSDQFLGITNLLVKDIQEVANQSEEITKILKVIQDLSRNTDLLALNAAIESARAGEAGKGFSVVSHEIRKLAERSKSETANIQNVVRDITKRLNALAKETTKLSDFSSMQEESVKETRHSFNGIANNVHSITDKIGSIQEAIKEVTQTTQLLTTKLEEISAISEETAASTQQVSASSESQTQAIEQVNLAAIKLQDLAIELEKEVDKFEFEPTADEVPLNADRQEKATPPETDTFPTSNSEVASTIDEEDNHLN